MDDLTRLYSLSVVNFHHIETEAVHSFPRSQENAPCRIEMTPNVHQNLMEYRKTHGDQERPVCYSTGWWSSSRKERSYVPCIVTWSKYMVMVRLLISDGSWLLFLTAEKATRPLPERTDIPKAFPAGSVVGVESQTTKHFPSSTMGSVSFWPRTSRGPIRQRRANRVPLILLDQYLKYLLRPLAVSLLASAALSAGPEQMQKYSSGDPLVNKGLAS